jgi:hypothetical protein
MGSARGPVYSVIALLIVFAACSTEYNRPIGSRSSGRATGGFPSSAAGGSGGFPVLPNGGVATATGGKPPGEPPGDDVLTLINGIVDAPRVLFCLTDGEGRTPEGLGDPFPKGGLEYGTSLVLDDLSEFSLDGAAFAPAVIAGELDLVRDMDCEEALALARAEQVAPAAGEGGSAAVPPASGGDASIPAESGGAGSGGSAGDAGLPAIAPPRLRTGLLPIVPPGTLSAGRSMLLVGTGCIGGPAFVANEARLACGETYSAESPTLSAVLVRLSRTRGVGKLGLQVVQASLATEEVEVRSAPLTMVSELPITLTAQHGYGVVMPDTARIDLPASTFGATSSLWGVQVSQGGSVLYSEPWADIAEQSGVTVQDSRSYSLVLVGPSVGLAPRYFWNASRVVVVENDPTYAP